ncbi:MAG: hypothetical protein R3C14_32780 [Caldilineaceae bacterium]
MRTIDIYLEAGQKRVFACALAWPGWSRGGRDEEAAQQALLASAPRYAAILHAADIDFTPPTAVEDFTVVERLPGNQSTDFGAPGVAPLADGAAMNDDDFARMQALLAAYWQALDAAVVAATGKELRKGPRGGGRDLAGIVQHVIEADAGYLNRLAWKAKHDKRAPQPEQLAQIRHAILAALDSAQQGNLPAQGPRGGVIWSPRYFVRRSAWHTLDHLWEIEDRIVEDAA